MLTKLQTPQAQKRAQLECATALFSMAVCRLQHLTHASETMRS